MGDKNFEVAESPLTPFKAEEQAVIARFTAHLAWDPEALGPAEIANFRALVLGYYRREGRSFPWRETSDPWAILVSELMLQQTQTERVLSKYLAFLGAYPSPQALAAAPLAELLGHWAGLGYNRRALALKRAANLIISDFGGTLPESEEALLRLPGVGPYTARAVLAFAFGQPTVLIETNIRSVFIHHFFPATVPSDFSSATVPGGSVPGGSNSSSALVAKAVTAVTVPIDKQVTSPPDNPATVPVVPVVPATVPVVPDSRIAPLVAATLVREDPRTWYYALMDYGVAIKKRFGNPNRRSAHYARQSPFVDSHRRIRGAVLRELGSGSFSREELLHRLPFAAERVDKAISELMVEGFLMEIDGFFGIGGG